MARHEPQWQPAALPFPWLVIVLLGLLPGCGSDTAPTNAAGVRPGSTAAPTVIPEHADAATIAAATEEVSAPEPSPSDPVTAVMVIRPQRASVGATVELVVHIRIAPAHFIHASDDAGGPFVPVAVKLTLPDGVEPVGDWQRPTPETGHKNSLVYRGPTLLRRTLRIASNSRPETLEVTGELQYQVCTDELCWPQGKLDLSASFTILSQPTLPDLKVLYVGNERAAAYVDFLTGKVARIEATTRNEFKVSDAAAFDVVLLDWPQGEETREMRKLKSPLGARDDWEKPTVLLGSAGLNLAVTWKLKGGSGCTCMDPLAYDLREHRIFESPFKIDRGQMISIPTPTDFKSELKESDVMVLPLVADRGRHWKAGWCTHARDFEGNPDVEFLSGGINHQTPTSAGLWRQGNLLHFGFEQSPAEMNELGQLLLLNSIAYISHFTEDRPIAITPSPFAGPVARGRGTLARWLRIPEYRKESFQALLAPETWTKLSELGDRETMAQWADENSKFLHPNRNQLLEIDDDLAALGVAFDQPEFFDKVLTDLSSDDGAIVARARRLLERYVPIGPDRGDSKAWSAWWQENQQFAFASDAGDYRWYIDPLAKKRRIPSSEMRGPRRAMNWTTESNG